MGLFLDVKYGGVDGWVILSKYFFCIFFVFEVNWECLFDMWSNEKGYWRLFWRNEEINVIIFWYVVCLFGR